MMGVEVVNMGKTSSAVKARYNAKAYDRLAITVPKGRKAVIDDYCREHGETVNGLVNELLRVRLGLSVEDWKAKAEED